MNINIFFVFVVSGLMMIFVLFKPLNIKTQNYTDVPLFDVTSFTLFEFNTNKLTTIMNGSYAVRFKDRYKVKDIDYTDNTREYLANIKANKGVYKDDVVDLTGDVLYTRDDGLTFQSETASYNKNSTIVETKSDYVSFMGKNRVVGTSVKYNNLTKEMESENVTVNYQLKERDL